MHQL